MKWNDIKDDKSIVNKYWEYNGKIIIIEPLSTFLNTLKSIFFNTKNHEEKMNNILAKIFSCEDLKFIHWEFWDGYFIMEKKDDGGIKMSFETEKDDDIEFDNSGDDEETDFEDE